MPNAILYYLRFIYLNLLLCISALYGTIASIVVTLIGKQYLAQYLTARFYFNVIKYCMGIDVEMINEEGLRDTKPYIAVSNHQSALDIFMLSRAFQPGCTVTAKRSLQYVPFLGWFMTLSGTYFLDRKNREKSVHTLNSSLQQLTRKKRALWIFAEGTRSYTEELSILPFKKGAFHLAREGKIPIVPVVVSNTSSIFCPKRKILNKGKIIVKVLDPISTADLQKEDVGDFAERVREKMLKELQGIGYSRAIDETGLPPKAAEWLATHEKEKEERKPDVAAAVTTGAEIHAE